MGTINVIFATLRREVNPLFGIMTIFPQAAVGEDHSESKRRKSEDELIFGFKPYDNALVVTLRIREGGLMSKE